MSLNYGLVSKRSSLPTMGVMLNDQIGGDLPAVIHAQMLTPYLLDTRYPVDVRYFFLMMQ